MTKGYEMHWVLNCLNDVMKEIEERETFNSVTCTYYYVAKAASEGINKKLNDLPIKKYMKTDHVDVQTANGLYEIHFIDKTDTDLFSLTIDLDDMFDGNDEL